MIPAYIPKTELVSPINHNGATDRVVIGPFSQSANGERQPGDSQRTHNVADRFRIITLPCTLTLHQHNTVRVIDLNANDCNPEHISTGLISGTGRMPPAVLLLQPSATGLRGNLRNYTPGSRSNKARLRIRARHGWNPSVTDVIVNT
jgi:hypothetical protein